MVSHKSVFLRQKSHVFGVLYHGDNVLSVYLWRRIGHTALHADILFDQFPSIFVSLRVPQPQIVQIGRGLFTTRTDNAQDCRAAKFHGRSGQALLNHLREEEAEDLFRAFVREETLDRGRLGHRAGRNRLLRSKWPKLHWLGSALRSGMIAILFPAMATVGLPASTSRRHVGSRRLQLQNDGRALRLKV